MLSKPKQNVTDLIHHIAPKQVSVWVLVVSYGDGLGLRVNDGSLAEIGSGLYLDRPEYFHAG